jgi:hypothetical protein
MKRLLGLAALAVLVAPVAAFAKKEAAPAAAPAGPAAFADSSAALLAGTNRVAIASVIIQFQASTNAVDGPGAWFQMFKSKSTSETVLAWPGADASMMTEIADQAYAKLKADLTAAGYEIVPEAHVKASPHYAALRSVGGIPAITEFANAAGDAYYVSPSSLPGYLPYALELGVFSVPKSFIGFASTFGSKSRTPGGPSYISLQNNWKVAGSEVALAKELNAHVVKATYVVSLGTATANINVSRNRTIGYDWAGNLGTQTTKTSAGTGEAMAQPGLMPEQTHIAFRTPTGNPKWQKVSLTKLAPPKDGDVSVYLNQPMGGSTDLFFLSGKGGEKSKFLQAPGGPDFKFKFTATLRDGVRYSEEVNAMMAQANQHMLALVKR